LENWLFYIFTQEIQHQVARMKELILRTFTKILKKKNVEIFGISRDSIKSHEKFKEKYNFPFELLSDSEETACSLFDVIKLKNMYGKQVQGIERSTFLIDTEGNLINEWRGLKVPGHAEEVLNSI